MPEPQPNIVLIGPSNIGDAVLACDVLAALRRQFPHGQLTMVVGERATALFDGDPRIQRLIDADQFGSPLGRLRLARELRALHPQVLIDLRHTLYPLLLAPWRSWRYLRQPPKDLVHMRARHLWKLRVQAPLAAAATPDPSTPPPAAGSLGVSPARGRGVVPSERSESRDNNSGAAGLHGGLHGCPLWFSPDDRARVEQLWRRWQLAPDAQVVVICPGARSHIKRWPAAGFAEVAERLITEARVDILFAGEPAESALIQEVIGLMSRRAHNAAGLVTIRQLGVVMERARLIITNDSAALHVASAVGRPTVAIFGPTDERKYGPTASASRTIRRRLFCAPCEQALCRYSHECMRFIAPEEVFEAAASLLRQERVAS